MKFPKQLKHFSLNEFNLTNKTVFLRTDYNVPLDQKKVADNSKIRASLPTIRFLLQQNCKVVLATHLGKPDGKFVAELKTAPLMQELAKLLPNVKITQLNDIIGKELQVKIKEGQPKEIFFLENLRFYQEEEQNDLSFAHSLAQLAEVYVNDAFAVAHRQHASVSAITKFLPSLPGFLFEKELFYLNKAFHPQRPSVWIIGGAKFDKIKFIENALDKADHILIGGALAFPFLKAKKLSVGHSKVDFSSVKMAANILKKKKAKKIILPVDFLAADKISSQAKVKIATIHSFPNQEIGLDLGPETIKLFKQYLRKAHTIVWNGPLGYFELAPFSQSTKIIGKFIGQLTAQSIVGGGETAEAIQKFHLEHELTHLSTGGGATLDYLSGEKLPALLALEENYRHFKKKIII